MGQAELLNTEPTVLNFDELLHRCTGRLELVERILTRFCSCFASDLDALELAATADDLDTVARIAHRVKGAAANVSARGLHGLVAETEECARRGQLADVFERVGKLRQEWVRFREQTGELRLGNAG